MDAGTKEVTTSRYSPGRVNLQGHLGIQRPAMVIVFGDDVSVRVLYVHRGVEGKGIVRAGPAITARQVDDVLADAQHPA